jgi:hypothetical protein
MAPFEFLSEAAADAYADAIVAKLKLSGDANVANGARFLFRVYQGARAELIERGYSVEGETKLAIGWEDGDHSFAAELSQGPPRFTKTEAL